MTPLRSVLAGMFSVALGFGVAIRLGFWLRPRLTLDDRVFGVIVVAVLVAVAAGAMRLIMGALPLRLPDSDIAPNPDAYAISLADFRSLVADPFCQPSIALLLGNWFQYRIVGQGPDAVVCSEAGIIIDLGDLHHRIQSDPQKQGSIYRTAMTLWH